MDGSSSVAQECGEIFPFQQFIPQNMHGHFPHFDKTVRQVKHLDIGF